MEEKKLCVLVLLSFVCIGVGSLLFLGQQLSLCCGKPRCLRLLVKERSRKRKKKNEFPTLSISVCWLFLNRRIWVLARSALITLMLFGACTFHLSKFADAGSDVSLKWDLTRGSDDVHGRLRWMLALWVLSLVNQEEETLVALYILDLCGL